MNKLLSALALAGIICIASFSSQSTLTATAEDYPPQSITLSVGASPDCPNISNDTLRMQASSSNGGSSEDCFIADIAAGFVNPQLRIQSTSQSFLPAGNWRIATPDSSFTDLQNPLAFDFAFRQTSASIRIQASGSPGSQYSASITLTASGIMLPEYLYSFTGSSDIFIAPLAGTYSFEVWGASGGVGFNTFYRAGRGGFSSGEITLAAGATYHIYVGGAGQSTVSSQTNGAAGGWNGGGAGAGKGTWQSGAGGGGASDVRSPSGGLTGLAASDPRIIVAGGGGGAWGVTSRTGGTDSYKDEVGHGGYAGGPAGEGKLNFNQNTLIAGGTASTGNAPGIGGDASPNTNGGGGGGWWGGYARSGTSNNISGGAGGSGYISPLFANAQNLSGNQSFDDPDGVTEIGHLGNGYIRVTFCGASCV